MHLRPSFRRCLHWWLASQLQITKALWQFMAQETRDISDDIRWSEAYSQHWVPMWDKNIAGPFQSKAHLPLQLYDLYLERYLPAAEVCGAHVDCTWNRHEHLQVMMGYEGWTTHGPQCRVTFLTAIFQVLPLWLHITSSTQLPQLHPEDISTQISFPFYLDKLHSLKLTAKSTWKWRSSAVIFGKALFCCVAFAVSFKEVALGFQPPLEHWAFSCNHHWLPKGFNHPNLVNHYCNGGGSPGVDYFGVKPFGAAKFGSKPLRFCTRNTESCQVLTGPLGGGWSGGVSCFRWAKTRENQRVGRGLTSFGMAYFQEFC